MKSIDDAKRSVALKTCVKLKEIGELNDNLNPISPEDIQESAQHLFPNWVDEHFVYPPPPNVPLSEENIVPGTNAKKRKHNLIVCFREILLNCI